MGLEELIEVDLDPCELYPVSRRGVGLDDVDHARHIARQIVVVMAQRGALCEQTLEQAARFSGRG